MSALHLPAVIRDEIVISHYMTFSRNLYLPGSIDDAGASALDEVAFTIELLAHEVHEHSHTGRAPKIGVGQQPHAQANLFGERHDAT